MPRFLKGIGHSSLAVTFVAVLAIASGPAGVGLAWAESLYLVEGSDEDLVSSLLREGFVVTAREAGRCLVYADSRLETVARELGVTTRLLDRETRGREYYLASGRPRRAPNGAFRRLARVGESSLVAVPEGEAQVLLDLGLEVRRLFRRSIRLTAAKSGVAPWTGVSSEAAIADLVTRVSGESLQSNVSRLVSFGTRNAKKAGCRQAAEWLAARFRGFGIEEVEIRTWSSVYAGNVIATIPGRQQPGDIVLLGGHFDSFAAESEYEPGADDNGSGTSTLLEVARLLAAQRLASTVRFVAFSAEEWGLVGSEAYASMAAAQGENIVAMLNFDMLGHLAPGDKRDLDLIIDDFGRNLWLLEAARDAAAAFVPDLPVLRGKLLGGRSDHESFWDHGYSAIFFFEDSNNPSPFIHSPDDVIGPSYNDTTLHAQSTRVALALTASLAGLQGGVPVTLQSFAAAPEGSGVRLQWSLQPEALRALAAVEVERSESVDGPWSLRTPTPLLPTAGEFVDGDAATRSAWFYRLLLQRQDGGREASQAVEVRLHRRATRLEAVVELEPGGDLQVRYQLGAPAPSLHLGVYDVRGRLRRLLVQGSRAPGDYYLTWDRRDDRGETLGNGVYFMQLRTAVGNQARKVILRR